MSSSNSIVSIEEARNILGDVAISMSDQEISEVVETLDLLAKDSLETARRKLQIKKDAKNMANLIYDIYQEKKKSEYGEREK